MERTYSIYINFEEALKTSERCIIVFEWFYALFETCKYPVVTYNVYLVLHCTFSDL